MPPLVSSQAPPHSCLDLHYLFRNISFLFPGFPAAVIVLDFHLASALRQPQVSYLRLSRFPLLGLGLGSQLPASESFSRWRKCVPSKTFPTSKRDWRSVQLAVTNALRTTIHSKLHHAACHRFSVHLTVTLYQILVSILLCWCEEDVGQPASPSHYIETAV